MRELDAVTIQLARDRGWDNPAIMDVGVSSGATTIDLLEAMRLSGLRPVITATDLILDAAILAIGPSIRILQDSRGNSLQYEIFGVGIRAWNRRLDFITGYFLLQRLARSIATRFSRSHLMDVKLISRLKMPKPTNQMEYVEDDLSNRNSEFEGRFDIVRAANVLNRSYFDLPKLRVMIANVTSYARKPGGLIIINRTHQDGTNHGTFFERTEQGIRAVQRIGNGSEVEALVYV